VSRGASAAATAGRQSDARTSRRMQAFYYTRRARVR
jgi:hypothetical protein